MIEKLFDAEEVDLLMKIATTDQRLAAEAYDRRDAEGRASRLTVRKMMGDDIYSAFVGCPRLLDPIEQILGGEAYLWNYKIMLKEPRIGGAWEWHQDYGYWYVEHACLFPLLASCMVAVDRATKKNGCLQAIRGSHLMGRVDHATVSGQMGADPERIEAALERMELVYCEMESGSALFFDSNLIHRSDQNRSELPRLALICSYNAARNNPFKQVPGGNPPYSRLQRCSDERIKQIGRRDLYA
jgi:ectoine hydroxylase-related dioxygenase (phytanoyl-CoA dioxygenase family)